MVDVTVVIVSILVGIVLGLLVGLDYENTIWKNLATDHGCGEYFIDNYQAKWRWK